MRWKCHDTDCTICYPEITCSRCGQEIKALKDYVWKTNASEDWKSFYIEAARILYLDILLGPHTMRSKGTGVYVHRSEVDKYWALSRLVSHLGAV